VVTHNRAMGPPWGAFCQITLTSCYFCIHFVKSYFILIFLAHRYWCKFATKLYQNCPSLLMGVSTLRSESILLITTAHRQCLTSPAERIPECLFISCSLYRELRSGLSGGHAMSGGTLCRSSSVFLRTRNDIFLVVMCWKLSQSRQQLDRCLAATVWAARHQSNCAPFTITPGCMKTIPEPGDTDWNRHAGTCLSETSEVCRWAEMVSNQQSFIDRSSDWSVARLF